MVYSLQCNTPLQECSVILQDFDNHQRICFENTLVTVITDNFWTQACQPISESDVEIRLAVDQSKAAHDGSVLQSDALSERITGAKNAENQISKQTVEEMNNLELLIKDIKRFS